MKVFVLGAGSWGTALANVLADNDNEVLIYARDEKRVEEINQEHTNKKYFDTVLNDKLVATSDLGRITEYEYVLLAVPSGTSIKMAEQISHMITKPIVLINSAKGFSPDTHDRLSVEIRKFFTEDQLKAYAAILGPSHAEEVVQRMQTTVNIVCEDGQVAKELQKMFANRYFRVYRNDDMIGCEYGAGLKNIIAIASGILYGVGLGDNAKASLMTRGLAEMTRYGVRMGGRKETFMGLCGMGDLIVTCTSQFSRNWQAGYAIGRNDSAEEFWRTNTKTVEGVEACRIIKSEAERLGISMPITNELYQVLFENKKPSKAIYDLMNRELKEEIQGF